MNRSAIISPCGKYRFSLERYEEPVFTNKGTVLFGLTNPSTANAEVDDRTVMKGWTYTRRWGYARMVYMNANPFRSTDPELAQIPPEEVLLENDWYLRRGSEMADLIVIAHGTGADKKLAARMVAILGHVKPLNVLELSKHGIPKHPLYLNGHLQPLPWSAVNQEGDAT